MALIIACPDRPVAIAEIRGFAVALHSECDRTEMDRRLAVEPLIGETAAIDPDIETGSFESLVADALPAPAHGFDFDRTRFKAVQFTGLVAKTLRTNAPGRHQQMRMIVAIIAVPVRGMNGEVD